MKNENVSIPSQKYDCEILLEKTTLEDAKNPSFPNDAYLIWYQENQKDFIDLTRGSRVNLFDFYYDKYGPNSIQKIEHGYGKVSPKVWGYKKPEKKKGK